MTSLIRSSPKKALTPKGLRTAQSDHPSLHGTVIRTVSGAGIGALVADVVAHLAGASLFDSGLFTIGVATGALAFVAARGKRWLRGLLGAALGGTGALLFTWTAPIWPWFAAALLGGAAIPVLAAGEAPSRKALTGLLGATLGYGGLYVGQVMLSQGAFSGLVPGPLASAAAGAAAGLFLGLAAAPKHIARPLDPVEAAYREALTMGDGEIHEILDRTLSIHRSVRADLAARQTEATVQQLGRQVGELAMRILQIAHQCRRIEADLAATPLYELEERMSGLRQRSETAGDDAARETYRSAIATLDGQRRAFDAISRGRERVIARLHANVALLEQARFSLLHLRSADAERSGGEISPVTDALEELGRELDATSSAVGEVFGSSQHQRELLTHPPAEALLAKADTLAEVVPLADSRSSAGKIIDARGQSSSNEE